jgi:DNA-binding MarR family transcriptional regulator
MAVKSSRRAVAEKTPASSRAGDPEFYRGNTYQIGDSVGFLLRQVRLQLERAVDAEMAQLDLTDAQWGPLLMIALGKGDTAAEIARFGCIDTGAMTRMLDRLEAKGLVRRARCGNDRRVVRLELTEEGQRLCRLIPYGLSRVLNSALRDFSPAEHETLRKLARRMLANLGNA